jgi:hypothetical protein
MNIVKRMGAFCCLVRRNLSWSAKSPNRWLAGLESSNLIRSQQRKRPQEIERETGSRCGCMEASPMLCAAPFVNGGKPICGLIWSAICLNWEFPQIPFYCAACSQWWLISKAACSTLRNSAIRWTFRTIPSSAT